MIGVHIRYTSTEGWELARGVRDTRPSAALRRTGLGAPLKILDSHKDWAEAVSVSTFPIARIVAGSDNYPVVDKVAQKANPQAEARAFVDAHLRHPILANGLTRVEVLNEPRVYTSLEMRWLCEFLLAAAAELHGIVIGGQPVRAVLGNFAAGSPDQESELWREARPLALACQRYGAVIGVHDYFRLPPLTRAADGQLDIDLGLLKGDGFAWRAEAMHRKALTWGWGSTRWAKTEAGLEWHRNIPGSLRWQEIDGLSGELYGRLMVTYASLTPWHVFTFTSGDASGWEKHGVDGSPYTRSVIDYALGALWKEEPVDSPATTPPPTPRRTGALIGFVHDARRILEVRYEPNGEIKRRLSGRGHWMDVFEIRDGFWRITDFDPGTPNWWMREIVLGVQ